jgi:hypothetical protein
MDPGSRHGATESGSSVSSPRPALRSSLGRWSASWWAAAAVGWSTASGTSRLWGDVLPCRGGAPRRGGLHRLPRRVPGRRDRALHAQVRPRVPRPLHRHLAPRARPPRSRDRREQAPTCMKRGRHDSGEESKLCWGTASVAQVGLPVEPTAADPPHLWAMDRAASDWKGTEHRMAGSNRVPQEAAAEVDDHDAMSLSRSRCSTPCPRCLLPLPPEKRERERDAVGRTRTRIR